jgi:alkylation response protein AidB-like acyl-CoA dehydrogenase
MTGSDLELTGEQREFRDAVRDFAEKVVAPITEERGRTETFPLEVVQRMAELGLFGLPFPERYGGLDGDFATFCLCVEELARVDRSVAATLLAAVCLGANMLFRLGAEEQKERWLVPMCRGRILGSLALVEPGRCTGARAVRATARLKGGEWVIDGTKTSVANSGTPLSEVCLVVARTDGGGTSVIVAPHGSPGFAVGPARREVALRAGDVHVADVHDLAFDGCHVPEGNLLSGRGSVDHELLETLDDERIAIAALSVGPARACLEELGSAPAGPAPAGLEAAVEAARLAYLGAARIRDRGLPYEVEAATAELRSSEIRDLLTSRDLGFPAVEL